MLKITLAMWKNYVIYIYQHRIINLSTFRLLIKVITDNYL